MMEITININCPALDKLAEALKTSSTSFDNELKGIVQKYADDMRKTAAPNPAVVQRPAPVASAPPVAPSTPAPVASSVAPTAPVTPPAPIAPPTATAPTAEPDYTSEQLGRAAAAYMDKAQANQGKLIQLLQSMGVQAITQLSTREMRTAFANGLRGLVAQV